MTVDRSHGPLGVFDSGVGGLTVVGALLRAYPDERVLYVADQAHVPYGGRPLNEVCGFASAISAFLAAQGCRAIIMACNISSATALAPVSRSLASIPVLGVIAPAVRRAVSPLPSIVSGALRDVLPRVGVLATEGTVRSGAYAAQLYHIHKHLYVQQVACPEFVPLVESGRTETPEAYAAARQYLAPLARTCCDTILLGCTHYPFLLPVLRRAAADLFRVPVTFIDPADEIAGALQAVLPDIGSLGKAPAASNLLLTTGDVDTFRCQIPRFLPGIAFDVALACWRQATLSLRC